MSTQESRPERLPSPAPRQASPHEIVGVGIAFSTAGLYFILGTAAYLPIPETNGPDFLIYCIGTAFLFAGLTCIVRACAGMREHESDVPQNAPRRLQLSYRTLGIGITGALAIVGTWIAVGSGPRAFNLSTPFIEIRGPGEALGRTIFALGAVIVWIFVIAFVIGTVRKIFDRYSG